jgi:5-formyltetrahydrofolate cyclo-ligase
VTKLEFRREMRALLRTLGPERAGKSQAIVAAIAAHPAFTTRARIALFSPLPDEPDIAGLWKFGGRIFCYPRVRDAQMDLVDVPHIQNLTPSAWHPQIHEPANPEARIIAPADIGLILVPGLAFTRNGQRLGRGGGFYDRYLALLPPHTVRLGVCFAAQLVESLPAEAHDQRVNAVVTELGMAPSR